MNGKDSFKLAQFFSFLIVIILFGSLISSFLHPYNIWKRKTVIVNDDNWQTNRKCYKYFFPTFKNTLNAKSENGIFSKNRVRVKWWWWDITILVSWIKRNKNNWKKTRFSSSESSASNFERKKFLNSIFTYTIFDG